VCASAGGPLLVSGGVRILDAEGTVLYEGDKAALCRCGGSQNKPFSDGTHRKTASVADPLPVLYQAESCPFSSAVREVLTELGVDFVARQVQPWPEERGELWQLAQTDQTPILQTEDGRLYRDTRETFAHLHERDPWQFAAAHRRRFADHRDARESDAPGQLIEYFRGTDELEAAAGSPADAEIVDVPEASRCEPCEVRGFGSRLAEAALDDARRQGLDVVPLCPFIAHFIEGHPEYEPLVASGQRVR
jgi:uncharacterized protein